MVNIDLKMTLSEIIKKFPETIDVFKANNFDVEFINSADPLITLATALKVKNLNADIFVSMLENKIVEKQLRLNFTMKDNMERKKLNFLGNCPCPIKHILRDELEESLKSYEGAKNFEIFVAEGCGSYNQYDNVWNEDNIDDLPDVIAGYGIDGFFSKKFIDRFVKRGLYKWNFEGEIKDIYKDSDCIDPQGGYIMYSSFSQIIVVDMGIMGELPVPRNWDDLLNPVYKNKIIIPGSKDGVVSDFMLLYIYQQYGDDGIRKLSKNIKNVWHSAKIAKMVGNKSSECAPIYVMPYFFAKSCEKNNISIIWPKDGGIVNPIYMLAKASKSDEMKPIIDFITGVQFGKLLTNINFPSFRGDINNNLSKEAKFKWLGWDYIMSKDMDKLKEHVINVFNEK